MIEQLERQLVRQLKILNTWITIFGTLFLLALGVIGFFLFQTVMFIRSTNDTVQNFRDSATQKLDVKGQVCGGTDAFANFVRGTGACQ